MNSEETKNTKKINWKQYLDKKYWKFYAIALAALVLIGGLIVWLCLPKDAGEPEETTTESTSPAETTPEEAPPADTPEFAEGQKLLTSVSIRSGNTSAEKTALEELKRYLKLKGVSVSNDGVFPISISIDPSLGDDSFRVVASVGEDKSEELSIIGGNGRGALYGVYHFLEKCADIHFYTPSFEVCEPGHVIIEDGTILDYTPVFEMRQTDWYNWMNADYKKTWCAKVGINITNGWEKTPWNAYLGGSITYAPELFVHTIGKLAELDVAKPGLYPTPCLSDETVYNTVLKNVLKSLENNPDTKILSVSQNDNKNYCKCEKCAAIIEEEGSPSGVILRFVNRIADAVAPLYPDVTIDTLAYDYSLRAPKITQPSPNVCIRLCTINCHFNHPLTTKNCYGCSQFSNAIEDWGNICENLYVWDYTTNYAHYMSPFPNFHVLRENMQFFASHNVKGVYEQGNGASISGEFGELRAYLIAKLLMNPYMSKEEYYGYMDGFLQAYYGEGWTYIRKYIDAFAILANGSKNGMGIYSSPLTVIDKSSLLRVKEVWNGWWDAAEAQAGDRLKYVQRSRWQLTYLLLFVEPDQAVAKKLAASVEAHGAKWSERNPNLLWYAYDDRWNVLGLTPDKWFTDPSAQ